MKARQGLLATVVSFLGASYAEAQTVFNWDPPPHANVFSTSTNWTPAGPPGTTGEAQFNTSASAYSVSFTTDPTNARVRVGNDHATFDLNGHTYTLTTTSTTSPSIMVGGITTVDDALLTVTDGTLAGQHAVIAPATLQTAAGMVVSTGGVLNLTGTFTIGKQKPGSLMIQNGGDVMSATGVLGESGAGDGSVTVTGNGSTWHNSGSVYVGGQAAIDGGNGTLSITDKGLVDIGGTLKLWSGGTVSLNGGTLETASMQLAGGAFNWTSGTLHLGSNLSVEPSGLLGGSVSVGAGKELDVDGLLSISALSTVNLQGGTLRIGSLSGGNNLNWTGGTLHLTAQIFTVNSGGTLGSALTIGPTQAFIANPFIGTHSIGESDAGTMTVSGGQAELGAVSIGKLNGSSGIVNVIEGGFAGSVITRIGDQSGSTGVVNIDGASLILARRSTLVSVNQTDFFVGNRGNGTLNITSGGEVVVGAAISAPAFANIGFEVGSVGHVRVDGVGMFGPSIFRFAENGILNVGVSGAGTLEVTNGGIAQATMVTIGATGKLRGNGTIDGNVDNGGLTSPGMSAGAMNIDGKFTQTPIGELLIELASASSYDQLLATGTSTLAGTLTVSLINGFVPSPGQSFTFLTSPGVGQTFTTEMLPSVPGRIFDVIYNPQSVVLKVLPAFTADFDEDGDVDAADLVQWRGDFGINGDSDADNDGDSDGDDFLAWQCQLGGGLPVVSAGESVPEPGPLALASLLACELALVRKRRLRH